MITQDIKTNVQTGPECLSEIRRHGLALLVLIAALSLAACKSVSTEELPNTNNNTAPVSYTGPVPATADVQAFKTNVWDNLQADNRCGSCHDGSGQSPSFVHSDDVNIAYSEAISVVDLATPANSRLVTKIAGGHNCWLDSDSACGAVMTAFISAWAEGSGAISTKQIQLTAPPVKLAGDSKSFPNDSGTLFDTILDSSAESLHDLLVTNCSGCHTESSATPQAPFFANSDEAVAYDAVTSKIDLETPANSRLVIRLRNEFHNCWRTDCQIDAQEMEDKIVAFANNIAVTAIDPNLVISKALNLTDGIIASGGSRHEANVIALYEFKQGQGNTLFDTSGIEPGLNLQLSGVEDIDYKWVGGWGIEFINGKAQGSTTASKKLHDMIKVSGEYSIEAWVVPANVTQEGPARIISYSAGTNARNFTLGQTLYNYDFLHRSSTTDGNGEAALSTADADEDLQATQQHVVVTFDQVNGRRIYVNGVFTNDMDPAAPGNINDWDDSFAFVLGNEASSNRQWQGKLRMVAIHNRALTQEQIVQNFDVGVGEKFFLLFSISDEIGFADSYIMFEVSQFDSYSYLFNKPTFISLDASVQPDNIPVQAMRIGINGKEAVVGQAFRNLDTTIAQAQYTATGQLLSDLGTIIALEKGPELDEFFLSFEVLGNNTNVSVDSTCVPLSSCQVTPPDLPPASDIGVRTFDEINATMANITSVSANSNSIKTTFDTIKQQLPSVESIDGFLSAHQMGVTQLAIKYCNELVDNNGQVSRNAYFPGFDFTAAANTAFDNATKRDLIIDKLLDNTMGIGLTTQPANNLVKTELNSLMDTLTLCATGATPSCATTARTLEVVKGTCAASLGSAVMLVQ